MATEIAETSTWNRREFIAAATAIAAELLASTSSSAQPLHTRPDVYIVPNFHPASCGWLTTFSRERVYCANSYLNQLDRVRDDSNYEFVISEINNIIAIMNFTPQRIPELKQRISEKRVEAVNGFFLESTINLSGGEALVRLGVLGQRWYREVLGTSPRYAWNIDTCGVHEQMPQIVSGLGLEALIYTRKNPAGKSLFWSHAPDGSKALTLCPGSYTDASIIFESKETLSPSQLTELEQFFERKELITPPGAPVVLLAGSGDYSLAPLMKQYPTLLLDQWAKQEPSRKIRFTTLSKYVDVIRPKIASGEISIPSFHGGTAYDFDAFWIENQEVKTMYRAREHALQASEALATAASLRGAYQYPVQDLYDAWILMCLNMDRNTLWGSAGGMVFVDERSWDVQDRFEWVKRASDEVSKQVVESLLPSGEGVALFNPLNWSRQDPVILGLPEGKSLDGCTCEALDDGSVLCQPQMLSASLGVWTLSDTAPVKPLPVNATDTVETAHYIVRFDKRSGCISSLKLRASGRELLSGLANQIVADRPKKSPDPGDHMPPIPERERLATSADAPSTISVTQGPLSTTVQIEGSFYGGGRLRRTIRFYANHPRIDFETELNDVPDVTVVYAEFPLAEDITEIRRGIPYGFSHGAWSTPSPALHGWVKGIVPAVRWIDYSFAGGGGVALFDRGLSGRELNGHTAAIYLLNAENKYQGYENSWLSGKGRHLASYALLPHAEEWHVARVPHAAWEYNSIPVVTSGRAKTEAVSFLRTSSNVIVEAMRREGNHVELRMVECFGATGQAEVELQLPHGKVALTDFMGSPISTMAKNTSYKFPVHPQQIVTMHFETSAALPDPKPVMQWDAFVPADKLPALHAYNPNLIGHPPFGE
ncbi:MAG TPA: glycoside hydrolase family 38 C-terminal domain-containing protein [Terracidiphilus sp.]|nr:glycoside hydrolase family 38 C-terminal domain-containing protein [Terracidiphilus sp.]